MDSYHYYNVKIWLGNKHNIPALFPIRNGMTSNLYPKQGALSVERGADFPGYDASMMRRGKPVTLSPTRSIKSHG